MIPYNKLTIIRNRHRARDLRIFRDLVETYFDRSEYVGEDMPVDWEGARAARSEVNRMLPRVIQIVHAAGLDSPDPDTTDPGGAVADIDVVRDIFNPRFANGGEQEILDVIDMALGVYEASRFGALARTVNPLHYAVRILGFVAAIPRRALSTIGLWPRRSRRNRIRPEEISRLEKVASRLADSEQLIESRFAELRARQAQQFAEYASQVSELAERLDFTERVLTQQRTLNQLESADGNGITTPV
jgi:hypothetical protein